jgi:hypothetical protein
VVTVGVETIGTVEIVGSTRGVTTFTPAELATVTDADAVALALTEASA